MTRLLGSAGSGPQQSAIGSVKALIGHTKATAGIAGLGLWNLNDGSFLLSPSVAYSASDEIALSGGLFFGFGDDEPTPERPLPSEYGLTGTTAYASFSIYF